jgi:hypothetical protein
MVMASAWAWICGTPVTVESRSICGGGPSAYGLGRL